MRIQEATRLAPSQAGLLLPQMKPLRQQNIIQFISYFAPQHLHLFLTMFPTNRKSFLSPRWFTMRTAVKHPETLDPTKYFISTRQPA